MGRLTARPIKRQKPNVIDRGSHCMRALETLNERR